MNGILEKLFGSAGRVKIIRLFLQNSENSFSLDEISRRAKVLMPLARREISVLKSVGLIKQQEEIFEEVKKLKNGRTKSKKKKATVFVLNLLSPFLHALRNLVLNVAPIDKEKMVKELNSVGKIKLIVLSGIFIQNDNNRVDLLLVGDSIKEGKLDKVLKNIEAEIGKEIIYAAFKTDDFMYRFGMFDRFIRDILEFPHEKIINKLNI